MSKEYLGFEDFIKMILTALDRAGIDYMIGGAVALQITLGVLTILSYVNIVIALVHQANALVLFALAVYFIHRLRALDVERSLSVT